MIEASAPGRCGLLGNPTDLYGGSVLSCTTRERARCVLEADTGGGGFSVAVSGQTGRLREAGDLAPQGDFLDIVRAALRGLGVTPGDGPGFRLASSTDLPMQAGLAGSTALLAAVVGCLLTHLGRPLNPYETAETVRRIEYDEMGVVCGFQDAYMSVFGGVNFLDFRDKDSFAPWTGDAPLATVEPLEGLMPTDLPLLLAHTGVRHHSGSVHQSPRERWRAGDPAAVDGYREVGRLARVGKRRVLAGDWEAVGDLMNRGHAIVRDLGGSGESNETLIGAALAAGAWGAKLAGAGGGGTVLVLAADLDRAEAALLRAGAERILRPAPVPGLSVRVS